MSSNDLEKKLEAIKKLIENIDLTKCEPTPWSTTASNYTDCTGEIIGYTHLVNGKGEIFISTDRESDYEVQVGEWFHLGDFYIAAQSVNAIAEIQNILLCEAKNVRNYAKWELGAEYEYAYCSHCGHQQLASWDSYREAMENIGEFHKEYKFCPNCGFKMKGATDEQ